MVAETSPALERLGPKIRDFKAESVEYDSNWQVKSRTWTPLYEGDKVIAKLNALPGYVSEAMLQRISDPALNPNYDKIVLDKWGKKDARTKKYVETPEMAFYRSALLAAKGMCDNNPNLNYEDTVKTIFTKMSNRELFPNTPYMANAGHRLLADRIQDHINRNPESVDPNTRGELLNELEQEKKIAQQLFACFVLDVYDSRASIFKTLADAAEIQAKIGGTGFNFSSLRPANETIHGSGGTTDGPVQFMSMYSQVLGKTMNQGGKREGANMFELDYNHPDIMRFIYCKRQDGEVSAANISVTVDHEFMNAASAEGEGRFYRLKNPHHNPKTRPHIPTFYTGEQLKQSIGVSQINKKAKVNLLLSDDGKSVLTPIMPEGLDEQYRTIGKIGDDGFVYLDAKKVLRHIAFGSWFNGEPGVINLGHINDANPTHPRHYADFLMEGSDIAKDLLQRAGINPDLPRADLERIVNGYVAETNEEGRQVNLPRGVGVLRSTNPCGEKPLLGNESCVLGHTNLESILDADPSAPSGYRVNYDRFKENIRIMYEILDNAIDQNEFTNPEIAATQRSNRKIGIGFMGLANMLYKLEIPYNSEEGREFVNKLLTYWEAETERVSIEKAEAKGSFPNFDYSRHRKGPVMRNAIKRTLAPTGTTGTAAKTTGGLEPEIFLASERTTVQGTKIKTFNAVLAEKLRKYPIFAKEEDNEKFPEWVYSNRGSIATYTLSREANESEESFGRRQYNLDRLKKIFVASLDIKPEDHIRMQAVVQDHVDDAISKTTMFGNNASVEDIERALLLSHQLGIKGVTFYRDGARKDQPIKTKSSSSPATLESRLAPHIEIARGNPDNPSKIPEIMPALKISQQSPAGRLHAFVVYDPANGRALETFATIGNAGSQEAAEMEMAGRFSSYALRIGGKLKTLIDQAIHIGSGEAFMKTRAGDITNVPQSFGLALKKYDVLAEGFNINDIASGKYDFNALNAEASDRIRKNGNGHSISETPISPDSSSQAPIVTTTKSKAGMCPLCGGQLIPNDGCIKCINFGTTCSYTKC